MLEILFGMGAGYALCFLMFSVWFPWGRKKTEWEEVVPDDPSKPRLEIHFEPKEEKKIRPFVEDLVKEIEGGHFSVDNGKSNYDYYIFNRINITLGHAFNYIGFVIFKDNFDNILPLLRDESDLLIEALKVYYENKRIQKENEILKYIEESLAALKEAKV